VTRLSVEKIETVSALKALEPEWRSLTTQCSSPLPFQTWSWADRWWQNFAEQRTTVKDRLFVRAFRDTAGELVAVAPLMLTEWPGVGPLRARCLQFFGADPNITEIRGLVCRPELEGVAHEALLEQLELEREAWDWMLWTGLRVGSDAARAVTATGPLLSREEVPNFLLPLAPTWDEFRGGLKRTIKESLRKCYNSLKRDGHAFTFEAVTERAEVGAAIQEFLRLHSMRASAGQSVQHRDYFEWPAAQRFLTELAERFAAEGVARVFLMRIAGKVVAARVGFGLGDTLYLYYSGYDPAWSEYSVMTTVVAEAIRYAIENGFKSVNLSTGRDLSKTRWGPQEVTYFGGIQPSRSARSRVAFRTFSSLKTARAHPAAKRLLSALLAGRRAA
jgi:CelD/BcsL family acetyltransferase involved in cellulose biosynthesis